jgi:hypothetical protein
MAKVELEEAFLEVRCFLGTLGYFVPHRTYIRLTPG